jgi:hypothetical protein
MVRMSLVAAVLSLAAPTLSAQQATDGPLAVVEQLFAAMRVRDTAAMRELVDPDVRLVSTGIRGGRPRLRLSTLDEWFNAVGAATVDLDERIWDPVVEIDHELATVWVKYEFVAGGRFSHCGVDAFQLFKSAEGWRIFQVADTQRREGCWHKPE